MLTARELRRSGVEVCLLERGETGREASWAGGGILSPLYPWRYPAAVDALVSWSQAEFETLARELREQTGIDPEWIRSGLLILDEEERAAALEWAGQGKRVEVLEPTRVRECEPALEETGRSALWMPDIAQVRNPRLVRVLKAALLADGVDIHEHTEADGLVAQGERIVGVHAGKEKIGADAVVVAGGAWSAKLLKTTGCEVDVAPVRGQMILFRAEPEALKRIVLFRDHYLIPRRDGRILAGSTLEHVGFDKSTTPAALRELRDAALALVPSLARYNIEQHWSGLRPGSPTGVPYVGGHPSLQGLFVNAGHFRNGVVLGPGSARLVADLVTGRTPIVDPSPYALGRARAGEGATNSARR